MGIREIIFGLIAVLSVYIIWQVIRFAGLKRPVARLDTPQEPAFTSHTLESRISGGDAARSVASAYYDNSADAQDAEEDEALPDFPPDEPAAPVPAHAQQEAAFEKVLELRQLRADVQTLREAQAGQEAEVKALREQFAALQELVVQLKSSTQISPLYGEAVSLSQRGYDASVIAERCGISVAEAQLVRSLSSGGPEGEESHGEN